MGKNKSQAKDVGEKRRRVLPTVGVDGKAIANNPSQSAASASSSTGPAQSQNPRPVRRRNTDDAVERCIQTKLQGISRQAIETQKLACGRLTRDKLAADIRATRGNPNTRLGATYWRNLRQVLGKDDALQHLATDSTMELNKKMLQALEGMCVVNVSLRSPEAMLAWLKGAQSINRRELIGILKVCNSPKKTTHSHAMQVVVATLRTLTTFGDIMQHQDVLEAARDLIDSALTSSYNLAKKNGVPKEAWLEV